jgi:beta-lactamase class A
MFSRVLFAFMLSALLSACVTSKDPRGKLPPAKPPKTVVQPRPMPPPSHLPTLSPALDAAIDASWRSFPGKTGVAVYSIDGGGAVMGRRLGDWFPQQSVSKLWVTMTVLEQVDMGRLRLDQPVLITRNDLAVFHSPIRDRVVAGGDVTESILSLIEQAIIGSDNTANDSLLRTAGGPDAVRSFIARHNLGDIRFGPGERAMQSAIAGMQWQQDYAVGQRFFTARAAIPYAQRKAALDRYLADPVDGASPNAIVVALGRLARAELLSEASTRLLLGIMARATSGPNRLKAGVPIDWRFAHKTGTGQMLDPVSTGYNDVGIMTAPDGSRYAVAVMMADTTATVPERMTMMQSISQAVAAYHRR